MRRRRGGIASGVFSSLLLQVWTGRLCPAPGDKYPIIPREQAPIQLLGNRRMSVNNCDCLRCEMRLRTFDRSRCLRAGVRAYSAAQWASRCIAESAKKSGVRYEDEKDDVSRIGRNAHWPCLRERMFMAHRRASGSIYCFRESESCPPI